jgi:SAM-dependent methyltransferase
MKHRWNERYAEEAALYGEAPNAFLVSVAERFPVGGRLLGLAEGQGRNARFLAGRGHPVVAVDSADVAVEPCAGVFAIYAHLPPAVRERAYRRAWEALEPGGVFVLEAFTPDQLGRGTGGPPMRELLFGAEELRALLPEARFELLEEREVELDEGPLHRGLAAVVRMVAVKD